MLDTDTLKKFNLMKPEWRQFLTDQGAEFEPGDEFTVASFGNANLERQMAVGADVFCDLSHQGLIEVYGDDARAFLQSQTTNNVNDVSPTRSQLGAYCNPKGRVYATFRIFQRGETFYLSLPRDTLEATLKRLRMYVLRSKVTLADAEGALVRLGLSGPRAVNELQQALGVVPEAIDAVAQSGDCTVIRIAGPHPRFEIYGGLDAMRKVWDRLNVRCAPVGREAWQLLDILAGLPVVYAANQEAFVPQMLNLQRVNGISFTKGCYPGQEIVARTQYLGQLKRRMYRVSFNVTESPATGSELFSPADTTGQPVGRIVAAARHPDGTVEALAVIVIAVAESGAEVRLGDGAGPVGRILPPPYGWDPADEAPR